MNFTRGLILALAFMAVVYLIVLAVLLVVLS
jgi:hypothetical protein